jgi:hypothetical protein
MFSFSTQTYAADNEVENHERWYQVEMIVFSRSQGNSQEVWPKNIKLSYPANLVMLKPEGNDPTGFNVLPASERQLNAQANTLARSGSYGLLFHQAWRQMIYGRNTNIFISGGKTFNGHQELEGSISLSVSQFLKLQTNLWLTQFAPAASEPNAGWPELPTLLNDVTPASESEKTSDYVIKRTVKINQQRSMRSKEVHYIDHPLLGIVIKIVPIGAKPE